MSRRISVLVAVTALAVSSFAYSEERASDTERTRQEKTQQESAAQATQHQATQPEETTQAVQPPAAAPLTLEEVFAVSAEAESIETEDGVSAAVGPIEVVVARIGPDGKPVMACVDDLKAARRFFHAPVEQSAPKQAKEQ
jgi:hypothetical protein